MEAREFIISKIKELVLIFPATRCRYEDHFLSASHFVEIIPSEIYHLDSKFSAWEEDVVFEFIQTFPDQNICFISDDALVGLSKIDFEQKGNLFDVPYSINQSQSIFDFIFSNPANNNSQIVDIPVAAAPCLINNLVLTKAAIKYESPDNWAVELLKNSTSNNYNKDNKGNNYDYALAA